MTIVSPKAELWERRDVEGTDTRMRWMVWTPRYGDLDGHCKYFETEDEARFEYERVKAEGAA